MTRTWQTWGGDGELTTIPADHEDNRLVDGKALVREFEATSTEEAFAIHQAVVNARGSCPRCDGDRVVRVVAAPEVVTIVSGSYHDPVLDQSPELLEELGLGERGIVTIDVCLDCRQAS